MNQSRADQPDSDAVDQAGSVGARQLFTINDLLLEGGPASPILARPTYSNPARRMHFLVPLEMQVPIGSIAEHKFRPAFGGSAWREVGFKPLPKFVPKGFCFFAVIEIH
jgi:hypothetical protein